MIIIIGFIKLLKMFLDDVFYFMVWKCFWKVNKGSVLFDFIIILILFSGIFILLWFLI